MQRKGVIPGNRENNYTINYLSRIPYAQRETRTLYLDILTPQRQGRPLVGQSAFNRENMDPAFGNGRDIRPPGLETGKKARRPVLIYVQGSGFSGKVGFTGLPLLTDLARAGFVAVTADYRGAAYDDTRFPDAIQDIKEAIRFLRANAEKYELDPNRIALMGSSSCGYAAMMCAVTGDDPAFTLGSHMEYSSRVQAVVDLFGPMDFELIVEDRIATGRKMGKLTEEGYSLFRNDVVEHPELLQAASVLRHITSEAMIPPVLILHGDEDTTIPLRQSERLFEALKDSDKEVEFYVVKDAGHEISFWGPETIGVLLEFLRRYLK